MEEVAKGQNGTTLTDLHGDILKYYLPRFLDDPQDRSNLRAVCKKLEKLVPGPARRVTRSTMDVAWRIFANIFTLGGYEVYNQYKFYQAVQADDLGAMENRWRSGASLACKFVPKSVGGFESINDWKPHLERWVSHDRKDLLSLPIRQDTGYAISDSFANLALRATLEEEQPNSKLVSWIETNRHLKSVDCKRNSMWQIANFRLAWPSGLIDPNKIAKQSSHSYQINEMVYSHKRPDFMRKLAQATPEEAERHGLRATTGPTDKNLLAYANEANNQDLVAYLKGL